MDGDLQVIDPEFFKDTAKVNWYIARVFEVLDDIVVASGGPPLPSSEMREVESLGGRRVIFFGMSEEHPLVLTFLYQDEAGNHAPPALMFWNAEFDVVHLLQAAVDVRLTALTVAALVSGAVRSHLSMS